MKAPLRLLKKPLDYKILDVQLVKLAKGDKTQISNGVLEIEEVAKGLAFSQSAEEIWSPYNELSGWGNQVVLYRCEFHHHKSKVMSLAWDEKPIDFSWENINELGHYLKNDISWFREGCKKYGPLGWNRYGIKCNDLVMDGWYLHPDGGFILFEPLGWVEHNLKVLNMLNRIIRLIEQYASLRSSGNIESVRRKFISEAEEILFPKGISTTDKLPLTINVLANKLGGYRLSYHSPITSDGITYKPKSEKYSYYLKEIVLRFYSEWFEKVQMKPVFKRQDYCGLQLDINVDTVIDAAIGDLYSKVRFFENNVCARCGKPLEGRQRKLCSDCPGAYYAQKRRNSGGIPSEYGKYEKRIEDRYRDTPEEWETYKEKLRRIKAESAGDKKEFVKNAESLLPRKRAYKKQ